jgi:hypothetical protein
VREERCQRATHGHGDVRLRVALAQLGEQRRKHHHVAEEQMMRDEDALRLRGPAPREKAACQRPRQHAQAAGNAAFRHARFPLTCR